MLETQAPEEDHDPLTEQLSELAKILGPGLGAPLPQGDGPGSPPPTVSETPPETSRRTPETAAETDGSSTAVAPASSSRPVPDEGTAGVPPASGPCSGHDAHRGQHRRWSEAEGQWGRGPGVVVDGRDGELRESPPGAGSGCSGRPLPGGESRDLPRSRAASPPLPPPPPRQGDGGVTTRRRPGAGAPEETGRRRPASSEAARGSRHGSEGPAEATTPSREGATAVDAEPHRPGAALPPRLPSRAVDEPRVQGSGGGIVAPPLSPWTPAASKDAPAGDGSGDGGPRSPGAGTGGQAAGDVPGWRPPGLSRPSDHSGRSPRAPRTPTGRDDPARLESRGESPRVQLDGGPEARKEPDGRPTDGLLDRPLGEEGYEGQGGREALGATQGGELSPSYCIEVLPASSSVVAGGKRRAVIEVDLPGVAGNRCRGRRSGIGGANTPSPDDHASDVTAGGEHDSRSPGGGSSAPEFELDVTSDSLDLRLPGLYALSLAMPFQIDVDSVTARFVASRSVLKVSALAN